MPKDGQQGDPMHNASTCARDHVRSAQANPRVMTAQRREGRQLAARIVARAASATSSYAGVAKSIGVSPQRVGQWADPDDNAASMTLGDILAARKDFARSVLLQALAQLDAKR